MQSKLHKALQSILDIATHPGIVRGNKYWNIDHVQDFVKSGVIEEFTTAPHYLVDWPVRDAILKSDRTATHFALEQIGAYALPHDVVVIEAPSDESFLAPAHTIFVLIRKTNVEQTFEVVLLLRGDNSAISPPFIGVFNMLTAEYEVANMFNIEDEVTTRFASLASDFIDIAIMMRHIRGVASEKVDAPERLNKARKAKNKLPLPGFTRMYVGAVEDNSGKSHTYTGRMMPVHMRAGHTRRQHYGKGNALVKTVYIQPVLVNYTPGDEVPTPKRIVKMATRRA